MSVTQNNSVFDGPVVVVGAGVAGLITAHLLAEAGANVTVIEKLDKVGGLARSFVYHDEFVFDCGPHRFDTNNPNVATYLDRVLEDGTFFPRKSEVFFKGSYYAWPIKPQNLLQLPPELAARAFVDLAVNGYKTYGEDNFENYILRQYGPTLYKHFFEGYSMKFLGIHPRETHSDWAKVGINRAIIDDNAQMQNLAQLLKSTLLQFNKKSQRFLYPRNGMHQAWASVARKLTQAGGRVITGTGAVLEGGNGRIDAVRAGDERIEPSVVVWTAPITLACRQLQQPVPDLKYLGLLLYNVMVREDAPRDYQWCYYGARELLINRVSIPRFFSTGTVPAGMTGYCCEVTCMKGDERWLHGERLTDWVVDDLVQVGLIKDRRNVLDVKLERLPNSYPIYHKTYPQELDKARKALGQYANLYLAGRTGLFWYNNMDHSMENAFQLTRRLLRESGMSQASEAAIAAGGM
ncbi:MAG: FAD-dependent oxidoreductase [Myxococcota bacterium]